MVQNDQWAFKKACLMPNNEFKWGLNIFGRIFYATTWFQYILTLGINIALLLKIAKSSGASQHHNGLSNVCLLLFHSINHRWAPAFEFHTFSSTILPKDIWAQLGILLLQLLWSFRQSWLCLDLCHCSITLSSLKLLFTQTLIKWVELIIFSKQIVPGR